MRRCALHRTRNRPPVRRDDDSSRRVGKAQRAHPPAFSLFMVGTAHVRLCPPYMTRTRRRSPRQILQQEIQRRAANTCMLASRSAAAGLQRHRRCSARPAIAHAAMAGGVAVAVAGRAGRAGFGQAPIGGEIAGGSGSPAIWHRARTPSGCPSCAASGISISMRRASRV